MAGNQPRGFGSYLPYIAIGFLVLFIVGQQLGWWTPTDSALGRLKLEVQTDDAIGEAVFSPAGASVKVWDSDGNWLGAMTEDSSVDGKWTGSFPVALGDIVILKVEDSGNTFYTTQVQREVTQPMTGVDRISILDPIKVYPRSATSASDIVGTMMTAGVEVDNSTGIATGETQLFISLTASSGKVWGGEAYYDYETNKEYLGAFMVFDLTTTTGRCTITGDIWEHFSVGSHEYWIIKLPQIVNDADLPNDGTYTFTITINNLVAATDCIDIHLGANAKVEDVKATSFGTNDAGLAQAEAWIDIHLNS
jgi:hypothetical protein